MLDVVGKTAVQLDELVAKLPCEIRLPQSMSGFFSVEETAASPLASCRRRFRRINRRVRAALLVAQSSPSLPRERKWHGVYLKDVSRGGVSFLHCEQLFPRERMRLIMPDEKIRRLLPDRVQSFVEIAHCRRIGEECFEIGAKFVDSLY